MIYSRVWIKITKNLVLRILKWFFKICSFANWHERTWHDWKKGRNGSILGKVLYIVNKRNLRDEAEHTSMSQSCKALCFILMDCCYPMGNEKASETKFTWTPYPPQSVISVPNVTFHTALSCSLPRILRRSPRFPALILGKVNMVNCFSYDYVMLYGTVYIKKEA